jgi:hypothetical protein
MTTIFTIVSSTFDLGMSNQPVVLAKMEHPLDLDASKRRLGPSRLTFSLVDATEM